MTRRACAMFAALCLLAPAANAQNTGPFADQLQACAFRHPVRNIPLLADLPPAVRSQLSKSPMAEKGAKFNSSDVIVPSGKMPALPGTRFIAAGQWQNLVYVWYEAGGIALFHHLALFRLGDGGAAHKIADRFDNGQDPCTATDAALDGGK